MTSHHIIAYRMTSSLSPMTCYINTYTNKTDVTTSTNMPPPYHTTFHPTTPHTHTTFHLPPTFLPTTPPPPYHTTPPHHLLPPPPSTLPPYNTTFHTHTSLLTCLQYLCTSWYLWLASKLSSLRMAWICCVEWTPLPSSTPLPSLL